MTCKIVKKHDSYETEERKSSVNTQRVLRQRNETGEGGSQSDRLLVPHGRRHHPTSGVGGKTSVSHGPRHEDDTQETVHSVVVSRRAPCESRPSLTDHGHRRGLTGCDTPEPMCAQGTPRRDGGPRVGVSDSKLTRTVVDLDDLVLRVGVF